MKKTTLSKKQFDEVINLLDLCQSVSAKYPQCKNAYELAVKGMKIGLTKYESNQLKEKDAPQLDAYLTWYMKTPIEFDLGEDNEDTNAWGNM